MEFLRELTDTELHAVSGGAAAAAASSSGESAGALAQGGTGASALVVPRPPAAVAIELVFANGPSAGAAAGA